MDKILRILAIVFFVYIQQTQLYKLHEACETPSGQEGHCIPKTKCPAYEKEITKFPLQNIEYLRDVQCDYSEGIMKVCCPSKGNYKFANVSILPEKRFHRSRRQTYNSPASGSGGQLPDENHCGHQIFDDKIVGGDITGLDEFPWMALLYFKGRSEARGCGGVLINERYILTAAHCLTGPELDLLGGVYKVRLGEYDVTKDEDCIISKNYRDCSEPPEDYYPEVITVHENYSISNHNDDIGLIRLNRNVAYSDFIQPICLPKEERSNYRTTTGSSLYIAGWGRNESGIASSVKLKARVPVYDHKGCVDMYKRYKVTIGDSQICAGAQMGIDSCKGDSGGPLMDLDKVTNRWVALGVVSVGPVKCGQSRVPGVYTKVSSYIPWIKKHIRDSSSSSPSSSAITFLDDK